MNQYHIYEKIGKGKYSTVYKGRRKKTISYHAIKSVDKSQKARVLQEVRTMHALKHKNILRFFAWYETTNHLWLILEYCVGGDLMSLLRQDVRLPESSVHDFGRDLVVALQYLHHNSIIYCDLKPSNILLDENGRLKLGGFGMSRRLADINKTPLQALPAAKRGTPCYMAPELFSEGATHSSASDLWALGCVLYESAMGRPPFLNSSFNQLVQEILHNDPAPIPGASREFADLITRLLDKNPATRVAWKELVVHPFWQVKLSWLDMPMEPQLEAFIKQNHLAPSTTDARASQACISAARTLRASVDVTRLSRIALSNLEKEGDGSDYAAVEGPGDIRIENADAELDFDEQREEAMADEDESPSPAQSDDGAVLDQSAPASDAARVGPVGMMAGADMKQGQGRARGVDAPSTRPSTANHAVAATPASAGPHAGYDDGNLASRLEGGSAGGVVQAAQALIWHSTDNAVKPIVANRRIERLPEPKFEGKSLPFTQLSLQDMLAAEQKELEHFLTDIYRAIASAAPLKDKVNVLSYFETLCVDTTAANVLINSSLTILFIRMLRNARAPTLRMRLASVLGLLVRHATYISDELSQTGVVEILTESLKDKNERVRRRVMATMGELLFYIATQQDPQKGITATSLCEHWTITPATIAAVNRLLKPQEDEVTQHYAVKTIENICSQGADWASRLCSVEVATHLVHIYSTTKNENLKATAASTISRVLHYNPSVLAYVVDKFGIRLFVTGLADPSSKVQIASVNMLNMALCHSDLKVRAKSALGEERSLVPSLMAMLDHAMPILRAKAVLAILLLSKMSTRWLVELCQAKLTPAIERLQREQEPHLQEAIAALRSEIAQLVASILTQVSEELKSGGRRPGVAASPGKAAAATKSPLQLFQVVLHLVTSPYFRSTAITPALITDLGAYVTAAAVPAAASNPGLPDFKTTLQHVLEALCQQTELLLQHHQAMLDSLLPALCEVVGTTSESHDMRFFSLRMITEVTQLFLLDPELYGSPSAESADQRFGLATEAVDKLMTQHVLPMVPQLLSEDDPMPLYALKLVGGLLEVNPAFVRSIEDIGLASQFFSFLSLEHSNNNVHNIRLCRQIVAAGSMPINDMANLQVAERVSAVLDYATQNNVEPFLEPVLELCHTIVMRDAKETEAGRSEGTMMAALLEHSGLFLELCASPEAHVSCAASLCLLDMVSVFPLQCAPWLLSSESLAVVVGVLQGDHAQGAPVPMQLHLNLLDAMHRSLQVPAAVQEMGMEQQQLLAIAKQLSSSSDALVRSKAVEVHNALATVMAT